MTGRVNAALLDLARRLGARPAASDQIVRLAQSGRLRKGAEGRWMRFSARQSIRLDRADFSWSARIGPLGLLSVCDQLQSGEPVGRVALLGMVPLSKAKPSPALLKGELMRYLAELPWAPDAMLANGSLDWTQLPHGGLAVSGEVAGVKASVSFTLDGDGLIATAEAPDRPRHEGSTFRERPWRGIFSDYRKIDGRLIPHSAEVGWIIDGESVTVWQGRLTRWAIEANARRS